MNIVVQKYGGSSVQDREKLEFICDRIINYIKKGQKLIIVVSAQGKTTDNLINLALAYSKKPNLRDLDMLLATGEMQTVSLLSMMLHDRNISVIGLTGPMAGIVTSNDFGNARIENVFTCNIENHLKNYDVIIVSGFQGQDRLGNITTLGRGGSDLTAVALASATKAKRCEIYTDVDGIYSADPKIVSKAVLLKKISYNEMLEAATSGSKVMHNRSINVAKKYNLNLTIKNSMANEKGTKIVKTSNINSIESSKLRIISKKDNLCKVSFIADMISENKELLNEITNTLKELNITLYMMSISEISINILIDEVKANEFINILHNRLM